MVPARGPHVLKRAMIWMTPLEPFTVRAATPAAIGAASPVWTRAGIVMNPSVAEANTQGANGMAQLRARVLEGLDVVAAGDARVWARAAPARRRRAVYCRSHRPP